MLDTEILSEIQIQLFEPDDAGATFPSGLWQRDEILANLNERQDRFLKATLTWVGLANLTAVIGQRVYQLPQDWLTTVGLVWYGVDGTIKPLMRSDAFEQDHGNPLWAINQGVPTYYMDEDTALLSVQVAPAPSGNGYFELIYVPQGDVLDGTGQPMQVTNEYAHAVGKYGTLADAFGKDGRGKNPEKAAYCELRYQIAIQQAAIVMHGWA